MRFNFVIIFELQHQLVLINFCILVIIVCMSDDALYIDMLFDYMYNVYDYVYSAV